MREGPNEIRESISGSGNSESEGSVRWECIWIVCSAAGRAVWLEGVREGAEGECGKVTA